MDQSEDRVHTAVVCYPGAGLTGEGTGGAAGAAGAGGAGAGGAGITEDVIDCITYSVFIASNIFTTTD